jgi:hypothetical protein
VLVLDTKSPKHLEMAQGHISLSATRQQVRWRGGGVAGGNGGGCTTKRGMGGGSALERGRGVVVVHMEVWHASGGHG